MKNVFLIVIFVMFGCKIQQQNNSSNIVSKPPKQTLMVSDINSVIIYNTKKYYSQNVPILLSEDKMQIVSYPHPSDLLFGKKLTLPVRLHKRYLLDNRGIGLNVAFLRYTYEEYSKLKDIPTLQQLVQNIIDKEPLTELWDCGKKNNYSDLQNQLNKLIDNNQLLEKCKRIR